jgi:predicted DNA-binding transcriptional regulator AlpA
VDATIPQAVKPVKLLAFEDLREKGIRKSKAQVNRDIKAKAFPAPVRYGRSPAWVEAEIDEWIVALVAKRDGKDAA